MTDLRAIVIVAGAALGTSCYAQLTMSYVGSIQGNASGSGSNSAGQSLSLRLFPAELAGGGGVSFLLDTTGGGGTSSSGLDDSFVPNVLWSTVGVQAGLSTVAPSATYRRGLVIGAAKSVNPFQYSANANSGVNSSNFRWSLQAGTSTTYLFVEPRGAFSAVRGLSNSNGALVPSGSVLTGFDDYGLPSFNFGSSVSNATTLASASAAVSVIITTSPCPWTWSSRPATASQGPRYGSVAAFDPTADRVLLFGGSNSSSTAQNHNDLWSWDGGDWKLLQADDFASALRPSPQRGAGFVFAQNQNCFYWFSGESSASSQSFFWKLDASTLTWTNLSSAAVSAGLLPRGGASLAYLNDQVNSSNSRLVLYGGFNATSYLADTWTFNGTNWTAGTTSSLPGQRASAAITFDPIRNSVLLFGGRAPGNSTADLWQWNGTAWTATSVSGSGPLGTRFGCQMVFDQYRGRVVLAGGNQTGFQSVNEAWELSEASPATWTNVTPAGMGGRANHAMAFDAAHSAVVVFGGGLFDAAGTVQSDTWLMSGPQITRHPVSQTVPTGATVVFTAAASAGGTLQWYRGYPPNRTKITGQTGTTLTLTNVQLSHSSAYSVDAVFGCGEHTSNIAELTVSPPGTYPCYANCDNSTAAPILNINDFQCFINRFAAGCT